VTARLEYGPRTAVDWLGMGVKRQRGVPASYSSPLASPGRAPPAYLTLQVPAAATKVKDDTTDERCPVHPQSVDDACPVLPRDVQPDTRGEVDRLAGQAPVWTTVESQSTF
jgi:hypothetical protein